MNAKPPAGASRPLRLTVFGANGGTGHALVRQALTAGHHVTAVTRHPEQFPHHHPRLVILQGDATNPADARGAVADANVVLSALGVPYSRNPITLYSRSARIIVAAMHEAAVRRLIVVTSAAVDPDGFPATRLADRVIGRYLIGPVIHRLGRTMYEDMACMEDIIRGSDLDWTILRPPALFTTDTPGPTVVSLTPLPHRFTARSDLAAVMLHEAARSDHIAVGGAAEGHASAASEQSAPPPRSTQAPNRPAADTPAPSGPALTRPAPSGPSTPTIAAPLSPPTRTPTPPSAQKE